MYTLYMKMETSNSQVYKHGFVLLGSLKIYQLNVNFQIYRHMLVPCSLNKCAFSTLSYVCSNEACVFIVLISGR